MRTARFLSTCRRAASATAVLCLLGAVADAQTRDGGSEPPTVRSTVESVSARDLSADVELLRAEVEDLRRQLRALADVVGVERANVTPAAVARDAAASSAAPAPQAPSGALPEAHAAVRVTGVVLSGAAFNSSDANWIDVPNLVGTSSGGSLTASLRQSRLGVTVDPFAIGAWQASGGLELDFFGGTPGTATGAVLALPRLVTATARLVRGSSSVLVGQDHVLFAPRDPTSLASLAVPQFYRAGNPFLRAPQLRVEQRVGAGLTVAGALVAPVTGDPVPSYTFVPPIGAGERGQRPSVEARVAYARGTPDDHAEFQIGASGHLGWLRQAGELRTGGGSALDLLARAGRVSVAGELFASEDLDAFGAGLAQPGRADGGWVEVRGAVLPRVSVTGGVGLDRRPDGAGNAGRSQNASAFSNVIVRIGPALSTSVEYRWLQTRYVSGRDRVNHHVAAVLALRF